MGRKLVSFDTDRIKEYVFATGKLKEIRGASAILDELNRQDMVEKGQNFSAEKIYANGGSGMFTVSEASTDALIQAVEREYHLKTLTGSITSAVTDLPDDFTNRDNVKPYLRTLGYRLRLKKDGKTVNQPLVTHPFLRTCDSCGEQYASHSVMDPESELLCGSCENKRDKNKKIRADIEAIISGEINEYVEHKLWHRLLHDLKEKDYELTDRNRPEDFNGLGEMSNPANYMGLIYADGDGMGKVLEKLENLDAVKQFSRVVDDAIYQSVQEAIMEYLNPEPGDQYFPFDILMLGGDDLVMVTTAHKAIEVSMKIAEKFSEYTKANLNKPLKLSVGVAITHTTFPFSSLLKLAEQALKFAKKEAAKRKRQGQEEAKEGLINFVVESNSNSLDFDSYYKETLSDEDDKLSRTLRPYSLADMRYLIETIRCLKRKSFPRGKLKGLQNAVFQSRNQSFLDGLAFLRGIKDKEQKQMFNFLKHFTTNPPPFSFPWFKEGDDYYTPFLDLIELYDFIEET